MEKNDHIISLIAKKLNRNANEAELQELQSWLESDTRNRLQYDVFAKIWEESKPVIESNLPVFDTKIAWSKMEKSLVNFPPYNREFGSKVVSFLHKPIVIAASVIAILISGYYIWTRVQPSLQSVTAINNETLRLPDGSIVLLRKGSSISYTPVFNSTERLVRLSGEAFFEVLRNKEKPFRIITDKAEVRVLGTSFLVRSNAYMDEIVVAAGKVTVIDKGKNNNQVMLLAGQKVILENNHFEQAQSTDSNYIAWKTGIMNFKNASLLKVLEDVGHYYGFPIGVADDDKAKIAKMNITVRFQNQPMEQIIEELRLITGLEIKKENDKITFYQK